MTSAKSPTAPDTIADLALELDSVADDLSLLAQDVANGSLKAGEIVQAVCEHRDQLTDIVLALTADPTPSSPPDLTDAPPGPEQEQ